MNVVHIIGNLTRDIEIRYTQAGSAIANTGVAVNKKWKDQNTGQMKEKVMFVDVTFFNRQAEIANQYLRKGSKIAVSGELDFQQWTAQDGSKRSKHVINSKEMDMLDTKPNGGQQQQNQYADQQAQYENNGQPQQNSGYSQPQQSTPQYAQNENGQPQQQYKDDGQPANYEQSQQYRNQNNNTSNSNPAPQGGYSDPQGQRR